MFNLIRLQLKKKIWRCLSYFSNPPTQCQFLPSILLLSLDSSVARGGGAGRLEPPHWPEKYAKYHVFCTFEADFWTKNENNPPKRNWNVAWVRT